MEGYTVVREGNKLYLVNEFWGKMMIYGVKDAKPYVKRLGSKFYLTDDLFNEVMSA